MAKTLELQLLPISPRRSLIALDWFLFASGAFQTPSPGTKRLVTSGSFPTDKSENQSGVKMIQANFLKQHPWVYLGCKQAFWQMVIGALWVSYHTVMVITGATACCLLQSMQTGHFLSSLLMIKGALSFENQVTGPVSLISDHWHYAWALLLLIVCIIAPTYIQCLI